MHHDSILRECHEVIEEGKQRRHLNIYIKKTEIIQVTGARIMAIFLTLPNVHKVKTVKYGK